MCFKYIFWNFLSYHLLCLVACFIAWKLYSWVFQMVSILLDFMKENHHEIFSLLRENRNFFFLFCNHGKICISFLDCLFKFTVYFTCKIHDFLSSCLMKIETFTTNLAERTVLPSIFFLLLLYVWIRIRWITITWEKDRHFITKNRTLWQNYLIKNILEYMFGK